MKEKEQQSGSQIWLFEKAPPNELSTYLQRHGFLEKGDSIEESEIPGDGNMNCVRRIRTRKGRSLVVKQARPWVEKYPQIPAPVGRILTEFDYYQHLSKVPQLQAQSPKVLGLVREDFLMVMEDLGQGSDATDLYNGAKLSSAELKQLVEYLSELHSSCMVTAKARILNLDLRKLNHQHIFSIPLTPNNGLDLDALTKGLGSLAHELRKEVSYTKEVNRLGELYLQKGSFLLHGDFYPGSWYRTKEKMYVIDPEFCFHGLAEFDWGVMCAHLLFAKVGKNRLQEFFKAYQPRFQWSERLALKFCGVELMRRLIGVAQLPLSADLEQKDQWLKLSRTLVERPMDAKRELSSYA